MKCPLCHHELKPSMHDVGYWYCDCARQLEEEETEQEHEERKKHWYENAKMVLKLEKIES